MIKQPQIGHIVLAFAIVAAIYLLLGMMFAYAGDASSSDGRQSWSSFAAGGQAATLMLPSSPTCIQVMGGTNVDGDMTLLASEIDCPGETVPGKDKEDTK